MSNLPRAELKQMPDRGSNDWPTIAAILDAGFLASVGFSVEGQPYVIPMVYGRRGRSLYLHGAAASRLIGELESGVPACISVTLVDGLVLARSAFNHSLNYRSVVAFGIARPIIETRVKIDALRNISDHMLTGRWGDVRGPNREEIQQTTVLDVPIDEACAKVREGPPIDHLADYQHRVWAGVLPLTLTADSPVPDERMIDGAELPIYLSRNDRFPGQAGRDHPQPQMKGPRAAKLG